MSTRDFLSSEVDVGSQASLAASLWFDHAGVALLKNVVITQLIALPETPGQGQRLDWLWWLWMFQLLRRHKIAMICFYTPTIHLFCSHGMSAASK